MLFGTTNYLAGQNIAENMQTIIKMIGSGPQSDTDDTYTKTSLNTTRGLTTIYT